MWSGRGAGLQPSEQAAFGASPFHYSDSPVMSCLLSNAASQMICWLPLETESIDRSFAVIHRPCTPKKSTIVLSSIRCIQPHFHCRGETWSNLQSAKFRYASCLGSWCHCSSYRCWSCPCWSFPC